MKRIIVILPVMSFIFCFCRNEKSATPIFEILTTRRVQLVLGDSIQTRFPTPKGYERSLATENSFAQYLRNLPLKPSGSPVFLFNGNKKLNQDAHASVIDMDIGNRDLQQCADAVMRLRAEYLFAQKKYEDIHFDFVNGFSADYKTWRAGNRISIKGNDVIWVATNSESSSYGSFRKYLNMVFAYAGTPSLEKQMKSISINEMQIGDVFIQGGSPGHAVIVVDMALDKNNGKKIFMLAQSYMPAQDIHILVNPQDKNKGPWYELDFGEVLITPEWRFRKEDLKRF